LHHIIASFSIASHHTSYRINRKTEHEAYLWEYFVE
jgi:predicted transcriptional regulator